MMLPAPSCSIAGVDDSSRVNRRSEYCRRSTRPCRSPASVSVFVDDRLREVRQRLLEKFGDLNVVVLVLERVCGVAPCVLKRLSAAD